VRGWARRQRRPHEPPGRPGVRRRGRPAIGTAGRQERQARNNNVNNTNFHSNGHSSWARGGAATGTGCTGVALRHRQWTHGTQPCPEHAASGAATPMTAVDCVPVAMSTATPVTCIRLVTSSFTCLRRPDVGRDSSGVACPRSPSGWCLMARYLDTLGGAA
jgi:hypothetical protein